MQTLEARLTDEQHRFVEELQLLRRALPRRAAEHPFVLAMTEGRATEEQVRVQCIQQYFHTIAFPAGLARLVSRCGVPEVRREITEGLYEEETGKLTGTAPHLELFYRYARSWGYTPEQLRSAYMLPETSALINWYMYACDRLSPLEAIAVFNVGAEGVNVTFPGLPGLSRKMYEALTQHYGRTAEEAFFWDLHDRADQEHSHTGLEIIARYADTPEVRERIRTAVRMTTDAWWHFMGGPQNWTLADCFAANSGAFYAY